MIIHQFWYSDWKNLKELDVVKIVMW
jgi:hypothetical protein